MVYADKSIRLLMDQGVIVGASEMQVNPASLNVRLGNTFLRCHTPHIVRLGDEVEYVREQADRVFIGSGEFMLATTIEEFHIPDDMAAFVQGRSSIGRIGLMVQNAGFVDPGFHGHITLELKNDSPNPIELVAGYPVAQMVFMRSGKAEKPYNGKYNGQVEATGSRMVLDIL